MVIIFKKFGFDALLARVFRNWGTIRSKTLDDALTGYAQKIGLLAHSRRHQSAVPSLTCYKSITKHGNH